MLGNPQCKTLWTSGQPMPIPNAAVAITRHKFTINPSKTFQNLFLFGLCLHSGTLHLRLCIHYGHPTIHSSSLTISFLHSLTGVHRSRFLLYKIIKNHIHSTNSTHTFSPLPSNKQYNPIFLYKIHVIFFCLLYPLQQLTGSLSKNPLDSLSLSLINCSNIPHILLIIKFSYYYMYLWSLLAFADYFILY